MEVLCHIWSRVQSRCKMFEIDHQEDVWSNILPQEQSHSSRKQAFTPLYHAFFKENKLIYLTLICTLWTQFLSHLDWDTNHVIYIIDKNIVDVIIGKMLWDTKDVECQTYNNVICAFTLNSNTVNYSVTIKILMTYHIAIEYVGIDMSLRRTTLAFRRQKNLQWFSKSVKWMIWRLVHLFAFNVVTIFRSLLTYFTWCGIFWSRMMFSLA